MFRVLSLAGLCGLISLFTCITSPLQAQTEQQRRKALLPQVRAATDCIAAEVSNELGLAGGRNITIPQAIDRILTRRQCYRPIVQLIEDHDRLMGPGSGQAFFQGPYLSDLPRAVSVRLQGNPTGESDGGRIKVATPISPPPSVAAAVTPVQRTEAPDPKPSPEKLTQRPETLTGTVIEMDHVRADRISFSLVVVGFLASILLLFILGFGSRVVIFSDANDLLLSASVFLVPVVTFIVYLVTAPILLPPTWPHYVSYFEMAKDNPAPAFIILVGSAICLWCAIATTINSIKYNGFIFGAVVAILKLGAAFMLIFVWHFSRLGRSKRDGEDSFFLFVVLAWIASRFVNGERVMERRMERFEERQMRSLESAAS